MATTNIKKAEVLSAFFSSVFTTEPDGDIPETETPEMLTPFSAGDITVEMVEKKLSQVNASKSPGPDGVQSLQYSKS